MLVRVFHLAASRHWRPSGPTLNYQKKGFVIAYTTWERQSCASFWVPTAISQSQRLFTTPWSASYSSTWPCEKWMDQGDAFNGCWCGPNSCGWLHFGGGKENVASGLIINTGFNVDYSAINNAYPFSSMPDEYVSLCRWNAIQWSYYKFGCLYRYHRRSSDG